MERGAAEQLPWTEHQSKAGNQTGPHKKLKGDRDKCSKSMCKAPYREGSSAPEASSSGLLQDLKSYS